VRDELTTTHTVGVHANYSTTFTLLLVIRTQR